MNKTRKRVLWLLLVMSLVPLLFVGCSRPEATTPVADAGQSQSGAVELSPEGLLPVENRPAVPEFTAKDFVSGDDVKFPGSGKVALYSFFSPG
jgi:hypothetical protein